MNGRRVLVTGAAGFIGRHLCEALATRGAAVEAWGRPGGSAMPLLSGGLARRVSFTQVSVEVEAEVREALAARPPDLVFHLAGLRLGGSDPETLARLFEVNTLGALNLLRAVPPETAVVVAGSCEEYGPGRVPFKESQPARPRSAYSLTKFMVTLACQSLARPPCCIARLAVVYGPGQHRGAFIPELMRACTSGQLFPMTRGDQTRDFVYVADAVEALMALADCEPAFGQVVNVGSGVESLIKEVAQQAVNLADASIELRLGAMPTRPGEAKRYVCSIEKVRSLTGWEPQTGLGEGLARTMAWWRRQA